MVQKGSGGKLCNQKKLLNIKAVKYIKSEAEKKNRKAAKRGNNEREKQRKKKKNESKRDRKRKATNQ